MPLEREQNCVMTIFCVLAIFLVRVAINNVVDNSYLHRQRHWRAAAEAPVQKCSGASRSKV